MASAMNGKLFLVIGWVATLWTVQAADQPIGHCIWYGQCGGGPKGPTNCYSPQPPVPLTNETGLKILADLCPSLYSGNGSLTCCDTGMLQALDVNMGLPRNIFARCPACFQNFVNIYCYFTCAPDQSLFMNAQTVMNETDKHNVTREYVDYVNYAISTDFGVGAYNSCKDVSLPAANQKAISMTCGDKDPSQCSPKYWLHYMGDPSNPKAPFGITFMLQDTPWYDKFHNVTLTPLNVTAASCTESCSCQDCPKRCPKLPPIPPPISWRIFHLDGLNFIMLCVFLIFSVVFGIWQVCYQVVYKNSLGFADDLCPEMTSINGSGSDQAGVLKAPEVVSVKSISCLERVGARTETLLQRSFETWGGFCAKHPGAILILGFLVCAGLSCGLVMFKVTTDPVKLWSAADSVARTQKNYFDQHFGPFYRTEQIIITRTGHHPRIKFGLPPPSEAKVFFTPLFDLDFLHEVLDLQDTISSMSVPFGKKNVTLSDVCFSPLAPDNNNCTIMSLLQYFQNSRKNLDAVYKPDFFILDNYEYHILNCVRDPTSPAVLAPLHLPCLAEFGGPVFPWVILGGYDADNYHNATALVITFIVNNHLKEEDNAAAEAWEKGFIEFMKSYSNPNMSISFSSERSIQDEINRESSSDVSTIVISYLIMFAYITIALGQTDVSCSSILVGSKVTVGIAGVLIVFISVLSSLGIYSYLGIPATLIIIEVVPFLVLAVGVDNIFILVQTLQRDRRLDGESREDQIGRVLGSVGPSMMLTSFSESIAFFLGALTTMPAVKIFSLYAAMAVLIDFFLQITCFVGLLSLDMRRQESYRSDVCCCVKFPNKEKDKNQEGFLYRIVKNYYSHFLMKEWVRPAVLFIFATFFLFSASRLNKVEVGLDQKLSMPSDSFVLDYFNNISRYLSVGPPVYFVVEDGHDYISTQGQNEICGGHNCPDESLLGQIYMASARSNSTRIALTASSWIDDYFDWIVPKGNPPCCRQHKTSGDFCPATEISSDCITCNVSEVNGRPSSHDFMTYLPLFLEDNPEMVCAKGGHAAYGSAVQLLKNKAKIGATYFMTYHTVLNTSHDYIEALRQVNLIAENITRTMNKSSSVFAYSVFYVFYEQYLSIVHDTIFNLGICIGAIFFVTFVLLGFDLYSAIFVVITILMILVDMICMMSLWNISLNAVSLVNLVMTVGISVEFCSHILRAFAVSIKPTRVLRAQDALSHMGSSVLSGITLTKLGGIIVLAFSKSQLFKVFYFRMYLGIVLFGATHGLIFLPVLLSYIGPSINKAKLYQQQIQTTKVQSSVRTPLLTDKAPLYYEAVSH